VRRAQAKRKEGKNDNKEGGGYIIFVAGFHELAKKSNVGRKVEWVWKKRFHHPNEKDSAGGRGKGNPGNRATR